MSPKMALYTFVLGAQNGIPRGRVRVELTAQRVEPAWELRYLFIHYSELLILYI